MESQILSNMESQIDKTRQIVLIVKIDYLSIFVKLSNRQIFLSNILIVKIDYLTICLFFSNCQIGKLSMS